MGLLLAAVLAGGALVGACGGEDDRSTEPTVQTGTAPTTSDPAAPTSDPAESADTSPIPTPSEPVDEHDGTTPPVPAPFATGPVDGQILTVVAVAQDDVLNFRSTPDPSAAIVATAATELVAPVQYPIIEATGVGQSFGEEVWWKVTVDDAEAWANSRFLGVLGDSEGIMPGLEQALQSLEFATGEDMAHAVGEARADGREHKATLVLLEGVDAIGGNAWVDVMYVPEEAVSGERIELNYYWTRESAEAPADGYRIFSATSTVICEGGTDCAATAFAPAAAQYLDIVGVRGDDVLNFRVEPDPTAAIVYTEAPRWDGTMSDLQSLDRGAFSGSELWWYVSTPDGNAWANSRFLGMLGKSEDIFTELEGSLSELTWFHPDYEPPSADNPWPEAPSALTADIVRDFADRVAAVRGDSEGQVVIVGFDERLPGAGESDPDAVAMCFDIVGLGDPAIEGERINLELTIVRDGTTRFIGRPLGFELSGASTMPICGRGVTEDGLCL